MANPFKPKPAALKPIVPPVPLPPPFPVQPSPLPPPVPPPIPDPARHERDRYLLELLDSTLRTVERVTRRMDHEAREDHETLEHLLHELRRIEHDLNPPIPPPTTTLATSISFTQSE